MNGKIKIDVASYKFFGVIFQFQIEKEKPHFLMLFLLSVCCSVISCHVCCGYKYAFSNVERLYIKKQKGSTAMSLKQLLPLTALNSS